MGTSLKNAQFLIDSRLADAARGDTDAYYDLGMVFSSGSAGVSVDLIEAHKWFNLAAIAGSDAAKDCRRDIAEEMSARDIVTAQAAARAFLVATQRRAA